MKNILSTLLIIFIVFSVSGIKAQESSESKRIKFDPTRDPFSDVKSAVNSASLENKNILLDVGGEWCIWCHRLDAFIEANNEIKNYLDKNYIVIKINYSEENKNEKFLSQFPTIDGYPHMFILDKKGKLIHSQNTGLLEKEKSYDADKIISFLKKWAPKK